MKKSLLSLSTLFSFSLVFSQNIGIGTNTPHQSAALEIADSSKGILIPRMTMTQRITIQNPAEGLMVYQTDSFIGFWYFDGTEWKCVANSNSVNNNNKINQTLIFTTSGF
jgi:hypothetical protein